MRIALGVEYDGSAFRGFQRQQPGVRTVQACLEKALGRIAAHEVTITCAGRTDAGVHALGQVIHFDTDALRPPHAWVLGTNSYLPRDVSVQWAKVVDDAFHARFSAKARRYRYQILNRPQRSALFAARWAWVHKPLALEPMVAAAASFCGERDFSSLRGADCQAKSPVRTVHTVDVKRRGDAFWVDVEANAFLHHMVRNLVGILLAIGGGDREVAWAEAVLAARDRTRAGVTAPAQGLCLMAVSYDHAVALPKPPPPPEAL